MIRYTIYRTLKDVATFSKRSHAVRALMVKYNCKGYEAEYLLNEVSALFVRNLENGKTVTEYLSLRLRMNVTMELVKND